MASRTRFSACLVLVLVALLILQALGTQVQEEFTISSPEELDEYIRMAVKDSRKESSTQNALEPGSEMFKNAEENAKRRMVYSESPTQYQKKQSLFGNMHSNLRLLASGQEEGDDEATHEKKEGDENGLLGVFQLSSDKIEAFLAENNHSQEEGAEGEKMLMLRNQATALLSVAKLGEEISTGAISLAGALSEEESEPLSSVNIIKVPWLAALQYAENKSIGTTTGTKEVNETRFEEWYYGKKMGGQSMYITRSIQEGQASPLGVLTAEEDVNEGEALLQMPLKCIINQLSIRNRRIRSGFLGEKLKKAFQHNQEWGLAIALLHERNQHQYGEGSKWGDWIETLRLRLLGTEMIQELKGTFAAQFLKIEDEEVESGYNWAANNVCKSDSSGLCSRRGGSRANSGVFTREDFRWALMVVKQNAVPVKLATTGKTYLSLVPMANLAVHHPDAGGEIILGLDNIAKFHVGEDVSAFHPIRMTKGPFTDAESFSRYHTVSEHVNKFNHVRMKIPGGGAAEDDLIYKVQTLRDWRKMVGLPPRSADLARSASQLSLYGEDEEEQKYMDRQNRLISGTNLEPITREEELMLTGKAKSSEEAALMIRPPSGSAALVEENYSDSQLYSAPDLDDDIMLQMAAKSLKESAHQFHIAVALNQTEEGSIGKVMNETRNFFKYGTAPAKGLDAVDQLLLQKIDLMDKCGRPHQFVIRANNISDELLCAMRVTFSNETEMNLLESNFNETKAITYANEVLMMESISGSILDLLAMHETSIEDDEEELESEDLSTKKRHAVTLRLREKQLLHSTRSFLKDRMETLDEEDHEAYQIAALLQEELERQRKLEDLKLKLEEEEERLNKKVEVASVEVKVKKFIEDGHYHTESVNLTIFEGDSLANRVTHFALEHELDQGARNQLESHLKNSVPNERQITAMVQAITRYGAVAVLAVREGDNVTDKVERFLLMQGILEESEDKFKELRESLEEKLNSRLAARLLVQIPVVAPDGRKLTVHVRDGEQHDMVGFMRNFAQYAKLPLDSIHPLAQEALRRLPPAILQVPVNIAGSRQINMRISAGDDDKLDEIIGHFCKRHDIQDEQAQHQIKRLVLSKLNPGASLL